MLMILLTFFTYIYLTHVGFGSVRIWSAVISGSDEIKDDQTWL